MISADLLPTAALRRKIVVVVYVRQFIQAQVQGYLEGSSTSTSSSTSRAAAASARLR